MVLFDLLNDSRPPIPEQKFESSLTFIQVYWNQF